MVRRRREELARAERFDRALRNPDQRGLTDEDRELADIARMLRPAQHQSEQHRAEVKERLMRAFDNRDAPPPSTGAGLGDLMVSAQPAYAVPGDGMEITLSDIEEIDQVRADEARRRILAHQASERTSSPIDR